MSSLNIYSPHDQNHIAKLELTSKEDALEMLDSAHELYRNREKWIPLPIRIQILEKLVRNLETNRDELSRIAISEGGKPYQDTQVEINRAIQGVEIAINYLGQRAGKEIPMGHTISSANRLAYTMLEPIGVVFSISAFNHPINLIIHQTITAFAAGCPVIIKPASKTPLSCMKLIELFQDSGLPKEWCQFLICDRDTTNRLASDERVAYLSFIGSGEIGWNLRSKLAPGTRCALEHGGVAPVIIERDADLDEMVHALTKGGFYHAGQVCVSVQKIYAHEKIAKNLAVNLAIAAGKLKVGDPADPQTDVGPMIHPSETKRVHEWVEEAVQNGAQLLCGGKAISDFYYEPTVILDPPENVSVSRLEVFGPVICVYSYSDRWTAIERANALPYSFQASVFTKHIDVALDTAKRLNATAVMINDHTAFRVDWMPFGGQKESGLGLGGIPYSIDEMSIEKLMVIKSPFL